MISRLSTIAATVALVSGALTTTAFAYATSAPRQAEVPAVTSPAATPPVIQLERVVITGRRLPA